jgi:hypothetical protein
MPGTARVTSIGAYVEIAPDPQVWTTAVGAYVEVAPPQTARVTSLGAYVEVRPISYARVTALGAYVELRRLVTPDLRLRHGKGFIDGVLQPYNSDT